MTDYDGRNLIANLENERLAGVLDGMMQVWNGGDLDAIDDLYTADVTLNGVPVGAAGLRGLLHGLRGAFPDQRFAVDDVIASGDRAAVRMTWTGTQTGPYRTRQGETVPPHGASFTTVVIEIYEIVGNRTTALWIAWDTAAHLAQLTAGT